MINIKPFRHIKIFEPCYEFELDLPEDRGVIKFTVDKIWNGEALVTFRTKEDKQIKTFVKVEDA